MSWVLSFLITTLIFSTPANLSVYATENLLTGYTPQLVASTPQTVLQGDETERFEQIYPLSANGQVSIDNVNGSIVIDSWDKNEVKLEAVKIANSIERLKEVEIKIDSKPDSLKIETEFGTWKNGNRSWNCSGYCRLEVQYKLTVPRGAVLNEIETVNGSITISNMTNYTKASAVNGSVKAINLRGTAHIETVNGTSEVDFDSLNSDSKINLSTVNGRVNLVIPSDADATIKAETVNGSITNDFNLPVRKGKYVGRDLYGKVGDGSVKINLESVNGGLNVKRKQDGKNTKSVVNLLNMKEDSDDEDGEDKEDSVSSTNTSQMNRDIAKAVKESTKIAAEAPRIAAEALKEAQKEMANNSKEIQRAQRDAMRATRDAMRINQDAMRIAQDALRWETFGNNWSNTRVEEQSETFPVSGMPKITVNAKDCAVSVKGWDKQEVKYRVTKLVRGTTQPVVGLTVNKTDSEVTIIANLERKNTTNQTTAPNRDISNFEFSDEEMVFGGNGRNSVRIEVFVPKKSNLRILTDREIRIEGISGNIDLAGNNEAINVRDSEGRLKIMAADALVRVIGFNGEIDSRTQDGDNFFEGEFSKFFAKSVDGKLVLTLPEDANANIEANTKIYSEGFDLTETDENENCGKIGDGGTVYKLQVANGDVLVRNAKLLKSTN